MDSIIKPPLPQHPPHPNCPIKARTTPTRGVLLKIKPNPHQLSLIAMTSTPIKSTPTGKRLLEISLTPGTSLYTHTHLYFQRHYVAREDKTPSQCNFRDFSKALQRNARFTNALSLPRQTYTLHKIKHKYTPDEDALSLMGSEEERSLLQSPAPLQSSAPPRNKGPLSEAQKERRRRKKACYKANVAKRYAYGNPGGAGTAVPSPIPFPNLSPVPLLTRLNLLSQFHTTSDSTRSTPSPSPQGSSMGGSLFGESPCPLVGSPNREPQPTPNNPHQVGYLHGQPPKTNTGGYPHRQPPSSHLTARSVGGSLYGESPLPLPTPNNPHQGGHPHRQPPASHRTTRSMGGTPRDRPSPTPLHHNPHHNLYTPPSAPMHSQTAPLPHKDPPRITNVNLQPYVRAPVARGGRHASLDGEQNPQTPTPNRPLSCSTEMRGKNLGNGSPDPGTPTITFSSAGSRELNIPPWNPKNRIAPPAQATPRQPPSTQGAFSNTPAQRPTLVVTGGSSDKAARRQPLMTTGGSSHTTLQRQPPTTPGGPSHITTPRQPLTTSGGSYHPTPQRQPLTTSGGSSYATTPRQPLTTSGGSRHTTTQRQPQAAPSTYAGAVDRHIEQARRGSHPTSARGRRGRRGTTSGPSAQPRERHPDVIFRDARLALVHLRVTGSTTVSKQVHGALIVLPTVTPLSMLTGPGEVNISLANQEEATALTAHLTAAGLQVTTSGAPPTRYTAIIPGPYEDVPVDVFVNGVLARNHMRGLPQDSITLANHRTEQTRNGRDERQTRIWLDVGTEAADYLKSTGSLLKTPTAAIRLHLASDRGRR